MKEVFLIDTHCHLDLFKDIQQRVAIEDNQPIKTITVTNSPLFYMPNVNLFRLSKNIRVALGLHPELALQYQKQIPLMAELIEDSRFIGEIGLDGSQDYLSNYEIQVSNFKSILEVVKKSKQKILTVHTRSAAKQTIELINQYLGETDSKVILHWYSGNVNDIKMAISFGYYFSINHKMIQSSRSRMLIQYIPIERILTETDAPFTFDDKIKDRYTSLNFTIAGLSTIFGKTEEEMKVIVYNNFKCLLQIK